MLLFKSILPVRDQNEVYYRLRMKKASKEIKAEWISLEKMEWKPDEDIAEDGHHYSTRGTEKMMKAVANAIKSSTNIDVLKGMEFSDQPYENIYRRHWKVGCYKCTRIHERGKCPALSEASLNVSIHAPTNSSNNSVESFHSIGNATGEKDDSEASLKISDGPKSPGGCSAKDVLMAVTRSHLTPNHSLTAPISAAVAAAAAAASFDEFGVPIPVRSASAGQPISEHRNRSSSAKRGRVDSDEANGPMAQRPKGPSKDAFRGHISRLSLEKTGKK